MALCAYLGILIERLAYRPLRDHSKLNVLITAIGVSLLLETLVNFSLAQRQSLFRRCFPRIRFIFWAGWCSRATRLQSSVVTPILLC